MRIHLVPNADNPLACRSAHALAEWSVANGHVPQVSHEERVACDLDIERGDAGAADLVAALGGDGTILKAVHKLGGADVPVLGINQGRLGFLCGAHDIDPVEAVERVIAGEATHEHRSMLTASAMLGGRDPGTYDALNEVFVGRPPTGRAVDLAISVDDVPFARWVCDGVVVATATGSTAYALSAGGPLVSPELRVMVIVPVSPHTLAARPVVLAEGSRVTVTMPEPARAEVCVEVDGDVLPCRTPLERIDVELAPYSAHIVRVDGSSFISSVRDTFLAG
jgi:NAD+ kinase